MPFNDPRRHFEDVLDAIDKIEEFIEAIDLNAYRADDKTKAAVERKIQVLTEAIIRLEDESPAHIPRSIKAGIVAWAIYFDTPTIGWTTV
jgi:uncharacterized protein with HEPN domain